MARGGRETGPAPDARAAVPVTELYHWCATVSALLVLQLIFDVSQHRFRSVPHPSEWCGLLLLLYAAAAGCAVRFARAAPPWAAWLLALGSFAMTCQLSWHWASHAALLKNGFLPEPLVRDWTALPQGLGAAAPPFPPYGYRLAFGSSGLDFLDTATFLATLFVHCVQSSFLCRLGVRVTAVAGVLQWIALACWPLVFPTAYPSWACRVVATGIWTAHLIRASHVWGAERARQARLVDALHRAVAESRKALKDGQSADSVLNHMLKNTLADASGCLEVFRQQDAADQDPSLLRQASDILFRGTWCCKMREALLRMVAGGYETVACAVDSERFVGELVRGRNVAHDCLSHTVVMDEMACRVILDNAVTNALRHGCPDDPQVRLTVEASEVDEGGHAPGPRVHPPSLVDPSHAMARPIKTRFVVTNRANPRRSVVAHWSTRQPRPSLPPTPSPATLSDGLGLQHIKMVADACSMAGELWQQGEEVFFELSFVAAAACSTVPPNVPALPPPVVLPPGVNVLGLDDSAVARRSLEAHLGRAVPDGTVRVYGADLAEVDAFKRAALAEGDILILDEHVHLPGTELRGSEIVKELMSAGYEGFACIRSGASEEADKALSRDSGAHWHVGKEELMRVMIAQLQVEYVRFLSNRVRHEVEPTSPVTIADSVELLPC